MHIKAIFVALLLAFSAATTATAQIYHKLGFTFGSNYSSLSSDLFTTSAGRLGFAAGCSFVVGINDHLELNQEIAFVQRGASAKAVYFMPEESADIRAYDYNYNSFEAAIFAGFQPSKTFPVKIQAGGYFGTHAHNLNRNNRDLFVGDYNDINNATPAADLNDAFSGVDFGPAVGLTAGDGRFRANIRYYQGVRNLYNNLDFVPTGHNIRTSSLRLTLTYFLK